MEVFIAQRGTDYEGFVILGVFVSRVSAQQVCAADGAKNGRGDWHTYEVSVYELGEALDCALGAIERRGEPREC